MPADFEAEARNGLRQLRSEVDALKRAQQELNSTTRNYASEASNAFKSHAHREAHEEVRGLSESLKELGHASKGVGGEVGELIHRFTGGLGLAGGFGAVALAAAGVHAAMQVFNEDVAHITEEAKGAAEGIESMAKAMEHAQDVRRSQAEAGASQAGARRKLAAVGGRFAVQTADDIAAGGIVDESEAAKGVTAAYGAFHGGDRTQQVISAAYDLAKRGVGFSDAVGRLIQHGGDLKDPEARRRISATVFNQATGSRNNDEYNYNVAGVDVDNDPFLKSMQEAGTVHHQQRLLERDQAQANAPSLARIDLANAKDPLAAAIFQLVQAQNAQLEGQRAMVEFLRDREKSSFLHSMNLFDTMVARWAAGAATRQERVLQDRTAAAQSRLPFPPGGG